MSDEELKQEDVVQPEVTAPIQEEDTGETTGLLTGSMYDVPDSAEAFIDMKDGKIVDKKDLTPYEIIKAIAQQTNTEIRSPRKGCRSCYGRGYVGIEYKTKMPIPCNCIYPSKNDVEKMNEQVYDASKNNNKPNHKTRRNIKLEFNRQMKRIKKITLSHPEKEEVELDDDATNILLETYQELKSIKKVAAKLGYTRTKVEKILKEHKDNEQKTT
jgi:S-adenosylmethionine synthetase